MSETLQYEGCTGQQLARLLGVPGVELHAVVRSTQDIAHERAQAGAPAGTLILADEQRAGRGRLGRQWQSSPGAGVWCTVIERLTDQDAIEVLSLRTGLAIAERLDSLAREVVRLKWPNDLVLGAGKVAGILAEARWTGPAVGWVAIGVGVNVAAPVGVPMAAGLPPRTPRLDVLAAVVQGVREAASRPGPLSEDELNRFRVRDILTGRSIASPEPGIVRGIAASGALLVDTPTGPRALRTGTVLMAEELA